MSHCFIGSSLIIVFAEDDSTLLALFQFGARTPPTRCSSHQERARPLRCWNVYLALVFVMICSGGALGQSPSDLTAGVRGGFSSSDHQKSFKQVELFSAWDLPISWQFSSNLTLVPRIELSGGYLINSHEDSFIATLGPVFSLRYGSFPVALESGIRGTGLSRSRFETRDFGIPFQFTTHIGLEGKLTPRLTLEYRLQHMSNLGFSSSNAGLNTHMFGLGYRF